MRRSKLRALAVLPASLAIVLASACGSSNPVPTPGPTPEPLTVVEVLGRSTDLMSALKTFHFEMTHEVGTTAFLPGLDVEETTGDVQPPDRLYAEFAGLFGNIPINAKLIAIGKVNYMTNPLTGEWQEIDANVSPIEFFNPKEGISSVMDEVTEAVFDGSDQDVYRITGNVPTGSLRALLGTTVDEGVVGIEMEIDAETLYLKQARFIGQVTPSDSPDTVRVVSLSKFNEPVSIEAPDIP
jgi:hypothetical protein